MDMESPDPLKTTESSSDSDALLNERAAVSTMRRKVIGGATTLLLAGAAAMYAKGAFSGAEVHSPEKVVIQKYEETVVVPPFDQCSKIGDNCMSTKCCKATGYKCFTKDASHASCKLECDPAKDGWCTELVTTSPVHTLGQRLFCFSFYTSDTGNPDKSELPEELSLLKTQLQLGASIFGCPNWAVFSDVEEELSPGPPTRLTTIKVDDVDGDFHLFKRKKTGTWVNAMLYYQGWKYMRDKNLVANSDWVVKADADAVFLPIRLLKMLEGYKVPEGGVYIENCKKVMYGFFGNLEVVSKEGFTSFLSNLESCKGSLDWKGTDPDWKYGPWGEDLFMQKCMDKIGVKKTSNFTLIADGMCKANYKTGTYLKKGRSHLPTCTDAKSVAYHPLKKAADYFPCLAQTQQIAGENR